jgi:hypothetical protein
MVSLRLSRLVHDSTGSQSLYLLLDFSWPNERIFGHAMLTNPHDTPAPSDQIARVRDFARDLAYGVVAQGWWGPRFNVSLSGQGATWFPDSNNRDERQRFSDLLVNKWGKAPPPDQLLLVYGYFIALVPDGSSRSYLLSEAAIRLLEKPTEPPSVFISYKRDQSSAFALLVEARLRIAGNPNPFVDKNIIPGDDWHARLESVVKQAEYFICLIGAETLLSKYVRKEIAWAEASDCRIIAVWHGCPVGQAPDCPPILQVKHAISVAEESAKSYEAAVNEILNAIGYATY